MFGTIHYSTLLVHLGYGPLFLAFHDGVQKHLIFDAERCRDLINHEAVKVAETQGMVCEPARRPGVSRAVKPSTALGRLGAHQLQAIEQETGSRTAALGPNS